MYNANMISYPHVEDYLEVIAGKKNLPGAVTLTNSFWSTYAPIINLARYDNSFLDNVTDQTMNGGALTDRQAELAVKLITKYRRQLHAQNIEVPDMTVPVFRRALRKIDRSKSAGVKDNQIYLKFPYDAKTIDVIRAMSKQSQGFMLFDRETKIWRLALTEYNVNWVYEYAKQNEFTIDQTLSDLMQLIIEVENQGYEICLVQNNQQLDITNAHASLKAYLENKIGSLDVTNINQLIDHACVLGYSVSSTLLQAAEEQVGGSTLLLMCNREYDFNQGEGMVERVIKYAKTANRYPIVVFNPTANQSQNEWIKHFDPEQVQIIDNKKDIEINHNAKLIYTHKALKHMNNIPLLISYVGMMIGADKQLMSGAAEKIFFTAKKLK
jgi:hypothetical protein